MLRINLLPGYVLLRRKNRQVAALFTGLFIVLTGAALAIYLALKPQPAEIAAKVAEGQAMQTKIANVNSQATAAITSLGPINTNLQTYKAVQDYNVAYPQLFQRVVDKTSSRVIYNAMSVADTTMTISGYTRSLGDLGRYLQLMYTEPDASSISLTSAIPGPTSPDPDVAQSYTIPAGVKAKLPGYPHLINSYTVQKARITSVNTASAAGGGFGGGGFGGAPAAAGFGGPPQGMPPGGFGRPPGGFSPTAPGGIGAGAASGRLFDARHDGFPFTVALTLKQALTPPSPTGAPATGTTGIPGAPGGFRGGGPPGAPSMGPPPGMRGPAGGPPGAPRTGPGM